MNPLQPDGLEIVIRRRTHDVVFGNWRDVAVSGITGGRCVAKAMMEIKDPTGRAMLSRDVVLTYVGGLLTIQAASPANVLAAWVLATSA